jgi:hypothetical protein
MCGDAGNPQIHVFVRDCWASASHYNTALLHNIRQEHVNAHLIPSHRHHFFHVKENCVACALPDPNQALTPRHNTARHCGLSTEKQRTKNEKQK